MSPEEMKTELLSLGWRIEHGQHSRMAFFAWKKLQDVPDCKSNESPPCVGIEYFITTETDSHRWERCEVKIAGDVGEQWVSLSAYNIQPDDLLSKLPRVLIILKACWVAASAARA